MKQKVLCIYHKVDLDGAVSAAIVLRRYGAENVTLVGWTYGNPFPTQQVGEAVKNGHLIILVDVSFSVEIMKQLSTDKMTIQYKDYPLQVIWIDHHITAIQDSEKYDYSRIKGIRTCERAACELTYEFLNGKESPTGIALLGQYDSWRQEGLHPWEDVLNFQYGMKNYGLNPLDMPDFLWTGDPDELKATAEVGSGIRKYLKQKNAVECKLYSFEAEIRGLRAICLNTTEFQTQTFASVYDEEKHDLMCAFVLNGTDVIKMSLCATKAEINCGDIARHFGGGGHKGAAGFQIIWPRFETFMVTKRL